MTSESTKRILEGYFSGSPGEWFAETIEYTEMPTGQVHRGRVEVRAWLRHFLHEAFSDVTEDDDRLTIADGRGCGEWVLRGRHTGSLWGEAPSGRAVEVPMAAVYEVEDQGIVRGRLYYDRLTLLRQMGVDVPLAGEAPR